MKTKEAVLEAVRNGRESQCLDGRDYARLVLFFESDQWEPFGFALPGEETCTLKPWAREELLAQLESDLNFGIEKAEGQRGISASLMYEVVKMWLWILDDPLQHHDNYHGYGLPFFEEIQTKYFAVEATRNGGEVQ
ncbi:hypothetical protein LCGC14_0326180 [marine sediment metagenome]|uniref:Uncharacterized protein n=1 Tax=marine sediment metagenome TaxID=412755 RepID=A0A0F9U0L0_9ZZZZ